MRSNGSPSDTLASTSVRQLKAQIMSSLPQAPLVAASVFAMTTGFQLSIGQMEEGAWSNQRFAMLLSRKTLQLNSTCKHSAGVMSTSHDAGGESSPFIMATVL